MGGRADALAAALQEISPAAVDAACCIFSTLLLKARTTARAARGGWGLQFFHALANALSFAEGGDVVRALWRFALDFHDWRKPGPGMPLACHHAVHLHATLLAQLLSVTSQDELLGAESPLRRTELSDYVVHATRLAATVAWEGAGAGADVVLEALLDQLGRALCQLHTLSGRLPPGAAPPAEAWLAPPAVLREFKRATASAEQFATAPPPAQGHACG
ncbi:unnamed protein product [Prorocentrum cordatum]|uniref:E3 ubiquitin-protein ligase n=1 Tax=Prorocentrum cordatum TaxID=2364126 RepID=A0ABN9WAG9_9DINO|nr:unnamed protein product [Polarella glacialis]